MTTVREPESVPASVPVPHKGRTRKVIDVIDDRLGIKALEYPVPAHANNLAWSLGGVTAASFGLLIVTGVLLVQFYNPVPEEANQSVRDMVTQVWGMGFVRALHFWASQAMYVTAVLHLLRVFLTGSYKRPREGNWLIGVAMLGLVIFAVFTGTVLKWDQEGFEALGHNLEIGKLLGGVGFWFTPEFAGRVPILVRLYGAHVVMIPGLIIVLFTLHGLLVKRHKISPHPSLPTDASGYQAPADEPTDHAPRAIRHAPHRRTDALRSRSALRVSWAGGPGTPPGRGRLAETNLQPQRPPGRQPPSFDFEDSSCRAAPARGRRSDRSSPDSSPSLPSSCSSSCWSSTGRRSSGASFRRIRSPARVGTSTISTRSSL